MKKFYLILSLLAVLVLTLYGAFSSTEEFNYSNGNLNTQNGGSGWSGAWVDAGNFYTVTNTTPAGGQGGSSIKNTAAASGNTAHRSFTAITAGIVSLEMRSSITNPSDSLGFSLREGTTDRMEVRFSPTGNIDVYDNGTYLPITTYSANTWYRIAVEFDDAAQPNKYRVQVNGAAMSGWVTVNGASYTNVGNFSINTWATGTRDFWIDDIRTTTITTPAMLSNADLVFTDTSTDPVNGTFTTTAGTNTLFLAGVGYANSTINHSSSTFNSDGLTEVVDVCNANFACTALSYLINPDVGAGLTLSDDYTSAVRSTQTGVSLSGVDTASPVRDSDSTSGAVASSSSLTLTTVAGDFCFSCLFVRRTGSDPGNLTPSTTAQTEVEEQFFQSIYRSSCLWTVATGTSTTVGWTWTTSTGYAQTAIVIKPAAASVPIISILSPQWRQRRQ